MSVPNPIIVDMEVVANNVPVPMSVATRYDLPIDLQTLQADHNGDYDAPEGTAWDAAHVDVPGIEVEPLSVTENGTYTASGKAYSPVTVSVPTGGPRVASGEFTLVAETASVEIVHGLDTQDVFVTLQRINEDHSTVVGNISRYRALVITAFDPATFIDNSQEYALGSSGNAVSVLNPNDSNSGNYAGIAAYFGAQDAASITKTMITRTTNGITAKTNNSVTITANYNLEKGRWVWKAYKLG